MVRFYRLSLTIAGITVGVALWSIVGLVTLEVIARYFFNYGFKFTIETSTYLTVFVAFVGGAYTQWIKKHIKVDTLVDRLPKTSRKWLDVATLLLSLLVAAVFLYWSVVLLALDLRLGTEAIGAMRIPLAIPHVSLVLGFFLLTVIMLLQLVVSIRDIIQGRHSESSRSLQ